MSSTVTHSDPAPVTTGPWPQRMVNPVQGYDWGSRSTLARLQGRSAGDAPEAELWMGAHPSAPSGVETFGGESTVPLDQLIAAAPEDVLGSGVMAVFGPRLPYLLKILAVDKPLSVQVHPTAERAAAAYAGEVGETGEHRYVDPFHKPELAYALEPTDVLCGFRSADRAAYLLGLIDCPRIRTLAEPLLSEDADDDECVEEAFRLLVNWPQEDRAALTADIAKQARALLEGSEADDDESGAEAGGKAREEAETDADVEADIDIDAAIAEDALSPADRHALAWAIRLARLHPQDPLVAAPFLLHLLRLDPGHTLFVPAGAPHAYLHGTVVEVMANSDNVLRAGLTHKPVAVEELLEIVDGTTRPVLDIPAIELSPHETVWRPPVLDFQLSRVRATSAAPIATFPYVVGPQIVLCTQGPVMIAAGPQEIRLGPGESAFVGAAGPPLTVHGPGEIFRASAGLL